MAYLDLDDIFARTAPGISTAPAELSFSALEWSVVAMARRDSLNSVGKPGRLARALGGLFGLSTGSNLADPRLEALRRMAVFAWRYGFALPKAEIERFTSAGFVEAQIETLVTSITGERVNSRHQRSNVA